MYYQLQRLRRSCDHCYIISEINARQKATNLHHFCPTPLTKRAAIPQCKWSFQITQISLYATFRLYSYPPNPVITGLHIKCLHHGLSSVLRPRQHSIGYMGDGFYRSKDQTNSIKVLKEQIVHRQIEHTISRHEHKTQQVP